jgi:uncharacterized protein YukE
MSGLAVPGGDPEVLEQLASRLEMAASGARGLGASTRQAATSIRSEAEWTGDAADSYTSFTGDLSQGATAAEGPLSRIAAAVRDYAGYLRSAQQEAQAYASLARAAQDTGDGALVSAAELAGQNAEAAIDAWQQAGSRAASEVSAASGDLANLFGSQGPVQSWIDRNPIPGDSLAGIPGAGDPLGTEVLGGPGDPLGLFGPEILGNPGGQSGPEILGNPGGELGIGILVTPGGEIGPEILGNPGGGFGPFINFSKGETEPELDGGGQGSEPEDEGEGEDLDPAENANKGALNKVSESQLEDLVGDAHEFKQDVLGRGAPLSRYNVYVDKSSGYLFLMARGKGSEPIPTYVNIGDEGE